MYLKIFLFLLGFGISVIGLTYIVGYLNLLTLNYSFLYYIKFIITRIECLIVVIGFILMTLSMNIKVNKNV